MNIADKERLYEEIQRVLRPGGGRLALHNMLAGPASPIHFPVPWARDPALSHLRTPQEVRALLKDTGFEGLAWIDETAPTLRWHQEERLAATPGGPPPLDSHLVFGDDFGEMFRSQVLTPSENRIPVIQAVFER
jgi:hypothetical protein